VRIRGRIPTLLSFPNRLRLRRLSCLLGCASPTVRRHGRDGRGVRRLCLQGLRCSRRPPPRQGWPRGPAPVSPRSSLVPPAAAMAMGRCIANPYVEEQRLGRHLAYLGARSKGADADGRRPSSAWPCRRESARSRQLEQCSCERPVERGQPAAGLRRTGRRDLAACATAPSPPAQRRAASVQAPQPFLADHPFFRANVQEDACVHGHHVCYSARALQSRLSVFQLFPSLFLQISADDISREMAFYIELISYWSSLACSTVCFSKKSIQLRHASKKRGCYWLANESAQTVILHN
jgi:hypothetical protein